MKSILFLIISTLISFSAFAQSKTVSTDVKFNSIVVLQDFQGDVTVQSWDQQTVKITTEDGTVLQVFKTEDAVFFSPLSGQENNNTKYIVYLPKTAKLDWYSPSANLNIKGEFGALKLENTTGNTTLDLQNVVPSVLAYSSN